MAGLQEFALDWAHHRSETLKLLSNVRGTIQPSPPAK